MSEFVDYKYLDMIRDSGKGLMGEGDDPWSRKDKPSDGNDYRRILRNQETVFDKNDPFKGNENLKTYKMLNPETKYGVELEGSEFKLTGDVPDFDLKSWYLNSIGYPSSYPISGFKGTYEEYVKEMEDQRKSRDKWDSSKKDLNKKEK